MTRNKELYLPIALSMALTFVSGLLCGFLGGPWAALTGSGSVLLTTLLWMSTTWSRYKKLQELGEYLASVYAGGELLDIRDNTCFSNTAVQYSQFFLRNANFYILISSLICCHCHFLRYVRYGHHRI